MPRLDDGLIIAPFDYAGDPLRPIAVGMIVTDEDLGSGGELLSDLTGFVSLEPTCGKLRTSVRNTRFEKQSSIYSSQMSKLNSLCFVRTGFNGVAFLC